MNGRRLSMPWQMAMIQIATLGLLLAPQAPAVPLPPNGPPGEVRAIFDEDPGWAASPAEIDARLQKVHAANFNVYVVSVWHGRGTLYPGPEAVQDEKLRRYFSRGWDPLEYAVHRAHELGIQVHPWFTVVKREDERHPKFYELGVPQGAYDVHNSAFRDYIVATMLDVVKRYDIDGINLDYIRSMGSCTSQSCVADYRTRTGFDLLADERSGAADARLRIQRWADEAVEQIVTVFAQQSKSLRPQIVISVDGHPEPSAALRNLEGRNEISWVNNGWIDAIFDMDYGWQLNLEQIERVRGALREPDRLHVLFANYEINDSHVSPREPAATAAIAALLKSRWPCSGVAVYLLNQLDQAQIQALSSGPFRTQATAQWTQGNTCRERVEHAEQTLR